jgi:hypothetical protein
METLLSVAKEITPLFRFQAFRHTAPSLRLFLPNSLTVYHQSFSSDAVLATSFYLSLALCFLLVFIPVAVITLQPLPPLPA